MKKKKTKQTPSEKHYIDIPKANVFPCKTCVDQCAGNGGGGVPVRNGCLCDDGTFKECM